jgi:hypothetical protein
MGARVSAATHWLVKAATCDWMRSLGALEYHPPECMMPEEVPRPEQVLSSCSQDYIDQLVKNRPNESTLTA